MSVDLHGRSFLKEADFTSEEWAHLLRLAGELKAAKRAGAERQHLVGRNIALLFEKASTRTRCAFEVGAHDQGAHVTHLDPSGSQLGHKESIADTARVLGRMFDGIEYRGFGQERVEELAAEAGVPVWNGLTDEWHPTQMLADQLTMTERTGRRLQDVSVAYIGDARFNEANSHLVAGALSGMDMRIIAPVPLQNEPWVRDTAARIAATTGARLTVTDDLGAVEGVDFLSTDVWVSMGEPEQVWAERIELLRDYQVDRALLEATGNPGVEVLHCLPAFHDLGTAVGRRVYEATGMDALEITDEVFEANADVIFDEAENRLHTQKAIMALLMAD